MIPLLVIFQIAISQFQSSVVVVGVGVGPVGLGEEGITEESLSVFEKKGREGAMQRLGSPLYVFGNSFTIHRFDPLRSAVTSKV